MSYYYTAGSDHATWSTSNATTVLNDGSAGDTSTSIAQNSDGAANALLTLFYDNGSAGTISANQFTWKDTGGAEGHTLSWALEGSTDHSSWSAIVSAAPLTTDASFHTQSNAGLSGTYQYLRLSFVDAGDALAFTFSCSDWRPTLAAATKKSRRTKNGAAGTRSPRGRAQ